MCMWFGFDPCKFQSGSNAHWVWMCLKSLACYFQRKYIYNVVKGDGAKQASESLPVSRSSSERNAVLKAFPASAGPRQMYQTVECLQIPAHFFIRRQRMQDSLPIPFVEITSRTVDNGYSANMCTGSQRGMNIGLGYPKCSSKSHPPLIIRLPKNHEFIFWGQSGLSASQTV